MFQVEGDIGGYPIPQYRQKNWQIPKYRVKNRQNTHTPFMIGYAYASTVFFFFFYLEHERTRNQPQPRQENVKRPRIYRYNDRKAQSLDATFHFRLTAKNCVIIYHYV